MKKKSYMDLFLPRLLILVSLFMMFNLTKIMDFDSVESFPFWYGMGMLAYMIFIANAWATISKERE